MEVHNDGSVTLSQAEYEKLDADAMKFNAMRNHGVDNWCGYDDAMQEYRDYIGDNDE